MNHRNHSETTALGIAGISYMWSPSVVLARSIQYRAHVPRTLSKVHFTPCLNSFAGLQEFAVWKCLMYVSCILTSFLTTCHSLCSKCFTNITSCISCISCISWFLHGTVLDVGLATVGGSYAEEAPGAALQEAEAMGGHGRPGGMKTTLTQQTQLNTHLTNNHNISQQSQQSILQFCKVAISCQVQSQASNCTPNVLRLQLVRKPKRKPPTSMSATQLVNNTNHLSLYFTVRNFVVYFLGMQVS